MAVLPSSSSSCLDLTISTPGFLSSSSSSSCKHLTPLPDSTTEEGSGVMKTTLNLFDMNQVPEDGDQEWLMVPATSMDRVDDDDQNSGDGSGAGGGGDGGGAPPRKKLRLSKEQSCLLEDTFRQSNTLSHKQKEVLAMQLKLKPRQVEVWFQNRRARSKLKQTEQECEYLKRWFGSLTEQNRRLRREVEQLRSLKVGPPTVFYPNSSSSSEPLPASTFTMCPRCERVSTSISASAADKGPTKSASAAASVAAAANLSLGPPSSNYHPRQHSAAC